MIIGHCEYGVQKYRKLQFKGGLETRCRLLSIVGLSCLYYFIPETSKNTVFVRSKLNNHDVTIVDPPSECNCVVGRPNTQILC